MSIDSGAGAAGHSTCTRQLSGPVLDARIRKELIGDCMVGGATTEVVGA
jgi:hypothetical protein